MNQEQQQYLKLAFALNYALRIAAADGEESYEEFSMLGQVFTRPLLRQAGFLGEDGHLTQRFADHRDMALSVLPGQLDAAGRNEIFQLLFAAAAVDALAEEEMTILEEAGQTLGFTEAEVVSLIGELSAQG